MGVLAWVFGKKRPALAEGIDDLLRARLRELLDKDPEFRSILRHAVREHLELLRDDLVSLSKAYQELGDALINSFETIEELNDRVKLLEVIAAQVKAKPPGETKPPDETKT